MWSNWKSKYKYERIIKEKEKFEKDIKELKKNLTFKEKEFLNLKNESDQNRSVYLKILKEKENFNKSLIENYNKLNS